MTNSQRNVASPGGAGQTTVFSFLQQQQTLQANLKRCRRSEILRSTLNRFKRFRRGVDLPFSMFDSRLMELFEAHLLNDGLKRNTVGFYMRTLRTYYNMAVEEGIAVNQNPFRRVYKSKDKTVKRALTIDELRSIINLDLSAYPALDYARDMMLFSFYARGMSFVDMAYLRKTDLQGTHFIYSRRKTGQTLCVEWVKPMRRILNKYKRNKTAYLLPIITLPDKDERRQYLNRTMSISRGLRKVGKLARISGACTLYRARHTWATLARYHNVPISVISEALGHDNEKTTQIYLDNIQSQVVDLANRQLLESL